MEEKDRDVLLEDAKQMRDQYNEEDLKDMSLFNKKILRLNGEAQANSYELNENVDIS